uniref:Uncharacterized protein n=1 Tax=Molossus molossus TaxID=27622 RepID=A0A7J8IA81_MOLMO|nr:hypothetical protein HJG59_010676 [Molossus molossus]
MGQRVVCMGWGTRMRLERGCVRTRGSVWPPQASGLMSRLPTPTPHPHPAHREKDSLRLSTEFCPPPHPSQTGWLYTSQRITPQSHLLSPHVPQHEGETVTWSLPVATLPSFSHAHSRSKGSEE